jgi:hypothetical protein
VDHQQIKRWQDERDCRDLAAQSQLTTNPEQGDIMCAFFEAIARGDWQAAGLEGLLLLCVFGGIFLCCLALGIGQRHSKD